MLLLRECFREAGWLATICHTGGDVGLLVTSIVPQTPFFWAMHITEVGARWWPCGLGASLQKLPGVGVAMAGQRRRPDECILTPGFHVFLPPASDLGSLGADQWCWHSR